MDELQAYAPEDIILSNLEEATLRTLHACEQEYAHLRELALEIVSGFHDSTSFLAALPEHRLPSLPEELFTDPTGVPEPLRPIFGEIATRHRVLLSQELRRLIPAPLSLWQEFFFPGNEEPDPSSFHRISYQKNRYTEKAFSVFSGFLRESRAAYAHSFPSVCADVYNGLSQYCILPLENSAEGRLTGFHRLIRDYDMKIVAVCDIQVEDSHSTRFALLAKELAQLPAPPELPRYFEFSLQTELFLASDDLLRAARMCGLRVLRADISTEGASQRLHASFEIGTGDLPAFLLYLAMEHPEANPIGIYPCLTTKPRNK